ncbi:immunity 17 family protein [Coprobacter tertius]|uniref:Immunity 17 family protein n=1 Tax=Coprobacter tertius TaxID=2944915 RepID=A0ABT1MGS7_9BACT|nr:immunity 17 family protein [Coprobacter tertius]MCP9611581.1 immunity 17 family protein [Coprobacter tertius]
MVTLLLIILFVFLGALSLGAAIANWKWFFDTQNGRMLVAWFGRRGARVFYAVMAFVIWAMAVCLWLESGYTN